MNTAILLYPDLSLETNAVVDAARQPVGALGAVAQHLAGEGVNPRYSNDVYHNT